MIQNYNIDLASFSLGEPLASTQTLNIIFANYFIIILNPMNNYWSAFYAPFMNQVQPYPCYSYMPQPEMFFGGSQFEICPTMANEFMVPIQNFAQISQQQSPQVQSINPPIEKYQSKPQLAQEKQKQRGQSDDEYCQRGQKSDRNIRSNAIKLFLKFIRNEIKHIQAILPKILDGDTQFLKATDFFIKLDELFPVQKTYVRPMIFISICKGQAHKKVCPHFAKALRILFKHFLKQQAYQLWSKKYLCNRKMLNAHLKAGRSLLHELNELSLRSLP